MDMERVRLMTKLALFEKKEKDDALQVVRYGRREYAKISALKNGLAVTTAVLLFVLLLVLYQSEYLLEQGLQMDWKNIFQIFVAIYLGLLVLYMVVGYICSERAYHKARKKVKEYDRNLHFLRMHIRKSAGQAENKK